MNRTSPNGEDLAWAAVNGFIVAGGVMATTLSASTDERTLISAVLGAFFTTAAARLGIPMGYNRVQNRKTVYEE